MSTVFDSPYDIVLSDPGLVENSASGAHCVHACIQMAYRTKTGGAVPSFRELETMMEALPGKYSYEYELLAVMAESGFDVRIVWSYNLELALKDFNAYAVQVYGEEIGQEYVENTDILSFNRGVSRLLKSPVQIENRVPDTSDIVKLIREGFYLPTTVNQRTFQSDSGYAAHSVLVYGAGRRGVRFHNPGPPAAASTEAPWDLFDRAWSFPLPKSRNLMAIRPNSANDDFNR